MLHDLVARHSGAVTTVSYVTAPEQMAPPGSLGRGPLTCTLQLVAGLPFAFSPVTETLLLAVLPLIRIARKNCSPPLLLTTLPSPVVAAEVLCLTKRRMVSPATTL